MSTNRRRRSEAAQIQTAVGRPSEYLPQYSDKVFKLCLLGATDSELADFSKVSEQTINAWKKAQPEFLESIVKGKDAADAEVAHGLYQRAKGYSPPAVKIMQEKGVVIREEYTQHYPPDTQAASLWLRNRQPQKWRDKVETEHFTKAGDPLAQLMRDIAASPLNRLKPSRG